ncbi:MAG TPA: universal stress protein [Longimicrobiales bacterium]
MSALGIRTILAATDLTETMLPALQTGVRLARLTDARLHIVHTTERAIPESLLDEHMQAAGIRGDEGIEGRILVGPPGALITQEAARLTADVILLGPHRPHHTRLGSTAYRVVYGAQIPCLMLPVPLSLPLRNVLVPLDISETARGALAVAITWTSALRQRGAEANTTCLTALHVAAEDDDGLDGIVEKEVEQVRRPFGSAIGVKIDCVVEAGTPAAIILRHAQQDAADMIVMATRGREPQKAALGSVSHEVVINADRPVLLVPPGAWRAGAEG